jgi:hypothetical protein
MDLSIEQTCPSCGAPIALHEADRLIRCPFCDGGNYLVQAGVSRFILPDKAPDSVAREDLLYMPYLRFKGNVFSCLGDRVDYKVIDTTHRGEEVACLPLSLGLRPQAMKLLPATQGIEGKFFRQTEKISAVFTKTTQLAESISATPAAPPFHRAFIGETISCIYLPLYFRNGVLYDAVLNRQIGKDEGLGQMVEQAVGYQKAWTPRFLATICPHCAGMLAGEHDSLVLSCADCASLWMAGDGAFQPVPWRLVKSRLEGGDHLYLPFWRIKPVVAGATLASFGDFLRLTNQPVVVTGEHDATELGFWIPAFKIRPNFFLQLARSMTVSQMRIPQGEEEMAEKMYPVTLPASEALQAVKTILADLTMDKRHFMPHLPSIAVQSRQTDLVYLPFNCSGHDLVQEQTSVSLASTVLDFGRNL